MPRLPTAAWVMRPRSASNDLEELRELALQLLERAAKGIPRRGCRLQRRWRSISKRDRDRAEVALTLRLLSSMLRDIELLNAGADESCWPIRRFGTDCRGLLAPTPVTEHERRLRQWMKRLSL